MLCCTVDRSDILPLQVLLCTFQCDKIDRTHACFCQLDNQPYTDNHPDCKATCRQISCRCFKTLSECCCNFRTCIITNFNGKQTQTNTLISECKINSFFLFTSTDLVSVFIITSLLFVLFICCYSVNKFVGFKFPRRRLMNCCVKFIEE